MRHKPFRRKPLKAAYLKFLDWKYQHIFDCTVPETDQINDLDPAHEFLVFLYGQDVIGCPEFECLAELLTELLTDYLASTGISLIKITYRVLAQVFLDIDKIMSYSTSPKRDWRWIALQLGLPSARYYRFARSSSVPMRLSLTVPSILSMELKRLKNAPGNYYQ